ncbi:hypothetical protein KQI84_09790 [bacterium]|nr:hypothetical protein [bacterium]
MRRMLVMAVLMLTMIGSAAAGTCTDTYEGQFIPHWDDPTQFFLTCWPIQTTETTVFEDINGNPFSLEGLTFDDELRATGCIDTDGFTLIADEVILLTPSASIVVSDDQVVMGVGSGPSWFIQTTTDPAIGQTGSGNPNPDIVLVEGQRYTFTNSAAGAHPFALIAKGSTAAGDTVLLAQGSNSGSMEADVDVQWEDNGNDVTFTVSASLIAALEGTASQSPGYRCEIHTGAMRGTITITSFSAVTDWHAYE